MAEVRRYTDTHVKKSLSARDVRELVSMFVEAYDNDWRPFAYSPRLLHEFYLWCKILVSKEYKPDYDHGQTCNREV